MKINTKRIMSITLATLITAGSTGIYAANFKDVSKNYWAKGYIDKCEKLGLLKGYEDGTFKPQMAISNLQSLITLARTLEVPPTEVIKLTQKHKTLLEKNKIPTWAMGDMAVAIEKGITDEKLLSTLFDRNGKETMGNREDLAILLINTMGLQQEVKNKGEITKLPGLIDAGKVTKSRMPYVLVLLEKNILRGDNNKNFNPKNNITRAEMSTVLELTYNYIKANNKPVPEKPQPEPEKPKVTVVLGTIQEKFVVSKENYLIVDTVTEGPKQYKVNDKSVFTLDGKTVSYKDLVVGLNVKMEISDADKEDKATIVTLTADSTVENYKGTLSEVKDTGSKSMIISYTEKGVEIKKFVVVNENATITLDGKKASFADLKDRDKASIETVNGKVTKIDAESTVRTFVGVIDEVDVDKNSVAITDKDKVRTLYGLDKSVSIMRNGEKTILSSLRKGDKVEISVENKVITSISAQSVTRKVEGLIQSTTIGVKKLEVTIFNDETKADEDYSIPDATEILLDGEPAKLHQFKLGYLTTITLDNDEVVKVEGKSK